jgi:hypothetical protein
MGSISAALSAAGLRSSFPGIQLALVVGIKRYRSSYSSVFWLNVSSKPALLTSLRRLGRVILPEPGDQLQDDMMLTQVSVWLSNLENSRWLLVFDNYDDPDQFNNIREYFPSVAQGSIIITTRRPNLVNGIKINVGSIAEKGESLRILATRSRRENVESSEKTSQRSVHA